MEEYRKFLAQAQAQHENTIKQAYSQLQALIDQSTSQTTPATDPPQSAWIKGTDGEQFLILNQSAADTITDMIERLKGVVAELAKMQAAKPK